MELARTLKTLWQRRRLMAVGVVLASAAAMLSVYRIGLLPPAIESRTNVFATASTQILVDTPGSAFADLETSFEPLDERASVFARFLASPAAVEMIAREAGLPADAIEAQGPFDLNIPVFEQEPTAEKRSTQIIGEAALYRLRFENNPDLPIISVFAQAPTQQEATELAAAAPAALRDYIGRLQAAQHTPRNRQVAIRRLGDATGGTVNDGANTQIAALVFLVVMVGWSMLLLPAQTIAQGWRQLDGEGNRNGHGAPNGRRGPKRSKGAHRAAPGTERVG